MGTIVYLSMADGLHGYCLEMMTTDRSTAENFLYNQVPNVCHVTGCRSFQQGLQLKERGVSWVCIELFDTNDKILETVQKFQNVYGWEYFSGEVFWGEPSRGLLEKLKLMPKENK